MKTLWDWFNNKKTTIGAALLLAAMVLQKMAEIWVGSGSPEWAPKLIETLDWLGGLFAGVGLSHKGVKAIQGVEETRSPQGN